MAVELGKRSKRRDIIDLHASVGTVKDVLLCRRATAHGAARAFRGI
jgi:hypothetical protein